MPPTPGAGTAVTGGPALCDISGRALVRTLGSGAGGLGPLQFDLSSGLVGGDGPSGWPCFLPQPPYSLLVPDMRNHRVQEVIRHYPWVWC